GLLAWGASALAEVTNGGFQEEENGNRLTGWSSDGTVDVETADGSNYYAVFKESGSGGLSRIYQDSLTFSADSPEPTHLRFRFSLVSDSQGRFAYTPPDSFSIFLKKSSGTYVFAPPGASAPSY
ncbi:MAG: hypothetical protein ACYTF1_24735, partial [Planctomycetota bacterium]